MASAIPNKDYTHLKNLNNVKFECWIDENYPIVRFFEINLKTKKKRVVSVESFFYNDLFPIGKESKNCPFLIHENIDFYVCLKRNKYKEKFEKLLKTVNND
ncbi:MAG: hypothetical protein WC554_01890 [Clostridia bacterium]